MYYTYAHEMSTVLWAYGKIQYCHFSHYVHNTCGHVLWTMRMKYSTVAFGHRP